MRVECGDLCGREEILEGGRVVTERDERDCAEPDESVDDEPDCICINCNMRVIKKTRGFLVGSWGLVNVLADAEHSLPPSCLRSGHRDLVNAFAESDHGSLLVNCAW